MDLPKHPVVHGHPIHAILSDGPVVLIPVAIAAELWERNDWRRGSGSVMWPQRGLSLRRWQPASSGGSTG